MENKNSSSTNVSNNIKPTLPPVRCIDIEVAIFDLYDIRKHIIVPNVSNQMCLVPFETDMLVLTESGYATGFEIKVSKSDLLVDLKKPQYTKFKDKEKGSFLQELYYAKKFKHFYYAVPKKLEETALSIIPDFAGLYVYERYEYPKLPTFKCVKQAKKLNTESWSEKNRNELMRSGCMRIYSFMFNVSKRTIIFICKPETLAQSLKRRQERGGSKIYYDKTKNTDSMRKHREYKKCCILKI